VSDVVDLGDLDPEGVAVHPAEVWFPASAASTASRAFVVAEECMLMNPT
jgi:hypothetical protein